MSWMIKKAFKCCSGNEDTKHEKIINTMNEAKGSSYTKANDCSSHSKTNSNTKDNTNKNTISSFTFSKKTSKPKQQTSQFIFSDDSSMSNISSISFASSSMSNLSSIKFSYEDEGKLKAPRTKYIQE